MVEPDPRIVAGAPVKATMRICTQMSGECAMRRKPYAGAYSQPTHSIASGGSPGFSRLADHGRVTVALAISEFSR
jgi:hypothetical protein